MINLMNMKKKNYTGPVTEFVALKPIYNICQNMVVGSDDDRVNTDDSDILSNEHSGGSWEDIWGAQ